MSLPELIADLAAEQEALDDVVAHLTPEQWTLPTSSPGWTVADQIAHLTFFDDTAATAITEPDRFQAATAALMEAVTAGDDMDAATLTPLRALPPDDLLERWRSNRRRLLDAAASLDEGTRVAWYGPSMGAESFLTARLMEAWAHGQDIVDAVAGRRPATDRLRHIAQLGVITHQWSYVVRGLEPPEESVAVVLTSPSGERWTWNDDAIGGRITGPAEDFCLVVTQRRHVDDTTLETQGEAARDWMEKAQAFAGGATEGPRPRA